jgi:hypothetical protein
LDGGKQQDEWPNSPWSFFSENTTIGAYRKRRAIYVIEFKSMNLSRIFMN